MTPPTTLKFGKTELITNDPHLLETIRRGRRVLMLFGLSACSLGLAIHVTTPWVALSCILLNIVFMAVNAHTLYGIWFHSIIHMLQVIEHGKIKQLTHEEISEE